MKRERAMGLAKRMLHLLDSNSTELAPSCYERSVEAFTSPEIFARERAAVFGATPMFIGMSSELPGPGTFFTRDIVDTAFLTVRNREGQVRLYLNACRHRGVKVATQLCGRAKLLTCPFHAWGYDLEGALVAVPEPDAFDDMDRRTKGLIQLPVAEKYGMIFGCATPGAEFDIDEVLGGLGPELAEWNFEEFTVYGEPHVHEVHGNWKFAWDTFCENYHFSTLHRKTLGSLLHSSHQGFDTYGRNVRILSAWHAIDEMRKLPEAEWNPQKSLSVQYRLYPAINFTVLPWGMAVYWIMPGRDPSHALGLHITYVRQRPQTPEEIKILDDQIYHGCENVVQNEDFWITALAQAGVEGPAKMPTFLFGRNEPALQHFHKLYAELTEPGAPRYSESLKRPPPPAGDTLSRAPALEGAK
jgi:phenylpropionate dioxygenase-like ring-hydroxylating dioxygenase large terminal subunit